jgi:hypothetical protein
VLIEILLAASCSIEAAALGVCECSQEQTEGSFEVCATERITDREEVSRRVSSHCSAKAPQTLQLVCKWHHRLANPERNNRLGSDWFAPLHWR